MYIVLTWTVDPATRFVNAIATALKNFVSVQVAVIVCADVPVDLWIFDLVSSLILFTSKPAAVLVAVSVAALFMKFSGIMYKFDPGIVTGTANADAMKVAEPAPCISNSTGILVLEICRT